MEPVFLKNDNGLFRREDVLTRPIAGLWQSIVPFDIDKDGDMDYVMGNWGLNSRFKASAEFPMKMYYNDFDKNGKTETVIAIEKGGRYYPLDGFDILAGQMVSLKKKFTSYQAFAGKTMKEIFTDAQLKSSIVYDVLTLASGYLKNENGKFEFFNLPDDLQISPIMAMMKYDFDGDGEDEVVLGGNYFGVQPFHGRYASLSGAIIKNENEILPGNAIGLNLINQSVRHFNVISSGGIDYLLVTVNNGKAQIYKLRK
jgi:hypothetical protein